MAKKGITKVRHRGFELQSSELWGSKNDLSAQLQFQLIGCKTKSNLFYFFLPKISTLFIFFWFFRNLFYHEIIVSQEPKMAWRSKLYVYITEHNW